MALNDADGRRLSLRGIGVPEMRLCLSLRPAFLMIVACSALLWVLLISIGMELLRFKGYR